MSELEEIWTDDLNRAVAQAKDQGRFDIAEYLSLKASNDAIRIQSVKWLFDTVLDIVLKFNRHDANILIEQKENHRFDFGYAKLSGERLKLRKGVRCLELEAGWTRTPDDGFMRGGAMACAKLTHFGFGKMNEEIVLLKLDDEYQWFIIADETKRISFNIQSLRKHFETFLGDL